MLSSWDRVRFSDVIDPMLQEADVPGCVLTIATEDEIVLSTSFGRSGPTQHLRPDDTAPFFVYSVSKVYLAAMAMRLVEQGRVSLDSSIDAVLADVRLDRHITLRHLLNHTSGLPDYGGMPTYTESVRRSPSEPWSQGAFLEHTLAQGMRFEPGSGFSYSNIGYMLVRRVIESITGMDLREATAHLLGIHDRPGQGWLMEIPERTVMLAGFTSQFGDGGLHDVRGTYHPGWVSHGVRAASAKALAGDFHALLRGDTLRPSSVSHVLFPVEVPGTFPPFASPGYGLGLMVDRREGRVIAGHGGSGPGYEVAAFIEILPDRIGPTVVVALNRDGTGIANEIAFRVGELIGWSTAGL